MLMENIVEKRKKNHFHSIDLNDGFDHLMTNYTSDPIDFGETSNINNDVDQGMQTEQGIQANKRKNKFIVTFSVGFFLIELNGMKTFAGYYTVPFQGLYHINRKPENW